MTNHANYGRTYIHVKDGREITTKTLPGGQAVLELADFGISVIIHGRPQAEALWDAMEDIVMAYRAREAGRIG